MEQTPKKLYYRGVIRRLFLLLSGTWAVVFLLYTAIVIPPREQIYGVIFALAPFVLGLLFARGAKYVIDGD